MSDKISVADYFNYILAVGRWDVWVIDDDDGKYILVDDFAAPPVNAIEILAIAVSEEKARDIAEKASKEKGLTVRFESTEFYEINDDEWGG